MKRMLLIISGFMIMNSASAQIDSAKLNAALKPIRDSLKTADSIAKAADSTIKKAIADSAVKKDCGCMAKPDNDQPTAAGWWLVFTPIILFVAFGIAVAEVLKGFDFKDALSENEIPKYTIVNPEYAASNGTGGIGSMITSMTTATSDKNSVTLSEVVPPTLEISVPSAIAFGSPPEEKYNYRPSISRYIAFFSGMLTVIIAVCMTSFFIYQYMHTGCPPDLSTLSTVLIALGIGVTPYMVNKVSTVLASRKTDN